jgi:hypothetical protein
MAGIDLSDLRVGNVRRVGEVGTWDEVVVTSL